MSQKITSKNLSYNSSLPPFLAALHAQASNSTGPDPQLAKQRRAAKKRSASEEAEDVPLVVDEHGNAVEVEVQKDGTVKDAEGSGSQGQVEETEKDPSSPRRDEAKAGFGARKRKVGKVIGGEVGEDEVKTADLKKATSETTAEPDKQPSSEAKDKKLKKKAKKIKLSFDEGD